MAEVQKKNNMKKGPFKMKGFSGFGNSPVKKFDFEKLMKSDKFKTEALDAIGEFGEDMYEDANKKSGNRFRDIREAFAK